MPRSLGQPIECCTATQDRLVVIDATCPTPAVIKHPAHRRRHLPDHTKVFKEKVAYTKGHLRSFQGLSQDHFHVHLVPVGASRQPHHRITLWSDGDATRSELPFDESLFLT